MALWHPPLCITGNRFLPATVADTSGWVGDRRPEPDATVLDHRGKLDRQLGVGGREIFFMAYFLLKRGGICPASVQVLDVAPVDGISAVSYVPHGQWVRG